jgi:hypothetical protein
MFLLPIYCALAVLETQTYSSKLAYFVLLKREYTSHNYHDKEQHLMMERV